MLVALLLFTSSHTFGRIASGHTQSAELEAFSAKEPIDAHVHLYKDDPAFARLMEQLNLHILNI